MKTIKCLLLAVTLTFSLSLCAATRYVSDDLFIYLHSGPSLEYRIIGTVQVGTSVATLKYDIQNKFMKIKTSTGKIGWVKNEELQSSIPAQTQLPAVKKELVEAIDNLTTKVQSNKELEILIVTLRKDKQILEKSILDLKTKNLELDLLQDTKDDRIKMEWMLNGGGVLILGLILGLLLPLLPRRKKRKNTW